MVDAHERQAPRIERPPFDELQEQLNEKRLNAVRMIRAWAVAEEIFAKGSSEEFGAMIARYNTTHDKMISAMPSSENSGYGYTQAKEHFDEAK